MSTKAQQETSIIEENEVLTYLEFYSGVGGWSYALLEACNQINHQCRKDGIEEETRKKDNSAHQNDVKSIHIQGTLKSRCFGAFDHSDLCHKVFLHNFPEMVQNTNHQTTRKNKKQKVGTKESKPMAIEKLTKDYLENAAVKLWMMSPPCQPHTRQHSNQEQDVNDPRSKSFLHLCNMISQMKKESLPKIVLLENVIGFESSNSCRRWRTALLSRNYSVLHFHLNPPQIGIPNDRPRYYCVAVLKEEEQEIMNNMISSCMLDDAESIDDDPPINKDLSVLDVRGDEDSNRILIPLSEYLDNANTHNDCSHLDGKRNIEENAQNYNFVSEKILSSNASWCFDIVTAKDRRSACFTHSYGKFIRGTGSILYVGNEHLKKHGDLGTVNRSEDVDKFKLVSPEDRSFDTNWNGLDLKDKLRYFTGREIARLLGFPVDDDTQNSKTPAFSFPNDCTEKQRWKLMGNSLNVKVASKLTELALRIYLKAPTQQS